MMTQRVQGDVGRANALVPQVATSQGSNGFESTVWRLLANNGGVKPIADGSIVLQGDGKKVSAG